MMKMTFLFWLPILLCLCVLLPRPHEASQEEMLRKLIEEKRSSFSSQQSDLVSEFETTKSTKKVNLIAQDGSMEGDKISKLPGQPEGVDFNQYAGYITVDSENGRALFYYFVESPIDSSSKPLLLWLNGGPGCSSLAYGAMVELGPFRVNSDGKTLQRNMYAWNNVANVLFLESPAGVGFSYSNTTSDHDKNGDKRTADDSYTFLVNWMERFPRYKNRDFFITGESYAGHYAPDLAYTILMRSKATSGKAINLKGIAIGNAFVDDITTTKGRIEYLWNHAFFSDETYSDLQRYCNFSTRSVSDKCNNAYEMTFKEIGNISIYNIYAPRCHASRGQAKAATYPGSFDPCLEDYMETYLNIPEVQKALHANIIRWQPCSDVQWNDRPTTMLPTIKKLIEAKLNIWLYSGDLDAVVPITDTRYFIKMLELPVKSSWKAWYQDNEVGGYVEQYEGLTLATVRGAGHMVPLFQPERALAMITAFIQEKVPA